MERFNALGRGGQVMLVACVLLFVGLFLPWQSENDVSLNAWQGVNYVTASQDASKAGWVLGLLTIVTLAWLVVRLLSVNIPLPVSTAMTGALLGVLVATFGIIKLLSIMGDNDFATIWAWIGAILAIAVAVGAYLQVQEAGGIDNLKSEIPGMPSSGTTAAAPPPPPAAEAAAAPPPPPAVEAAPAAPETPSAPPMSEGAAPEAAVSEPDTDTHTPSTERET